MSLEEEKAEAVRRFLSEPEAGGSGPRRVGRYTLFEVLGEGAAGVVFRARDEELGREVALKVLKTFTAFQIGLNDLARERFRREAQAAAKISHPNVVAVHDVGEVEGQVYIAMDLIEGCALGALLKEGKLRENQVVALIEKVAQGVAAAHVKGVIHRDLKPANILVTTSGEPKVGDFGLAHLTDPSVELTRTGATVGSPLYMSPEQAAGRSKDVTPRTDVYALGAILYEALTGRTPHTGESAQRVYERIQNEEPVRPRNLNSDISRDLETVVLKCLEKEPSARYAGAGELADDLRKVLHGEPIAARPIGVLARGGRKIRRNPLPYGLGTAAGAAALVAVALGLAGRSERAIGVREMREKARISLRAALDLRRAGASDRMREFLPPVEATYREALKRAPDVAEVDYLMGRVYRALMQNPKALEHQRRALLKDPSFAPALYERAVLVSLQVGSRMQGALRSLYVLEKAPRTAEEARQAPPADLARATGGELEDQVRRDCTLLEELVRKGQGTGFVSEANVLAARGILACYAWDYEEARKLLREAVTGDPLIEEAWENLVALESWHGVPWVRGDDAAWTNWDKTVTEALSHDRGYLPHWLQRVELRHARGWDRMLRGEDPQEILAAAEEDVAQAIRLNPRSPEAVNLQGLLRAARGLFLAARGRDPLQEFAAAERDLTHAAGAYGSGSKAWRERGVVRTLRGMHRMGAGEDPTVDFQEAEEDFTRALGGGGWVEFCWNERGYVRAQRGSYVMSRGGDALEQLAAAESDFGEALRLNRTLAPAWRNRGVLRVLRSVCRMAQGEDPSADFSLGEDDLTEALRLDRELGESRPAEPASRWLHLTRGVQALWTISTNGSPGWTERGKTRTLGASFRITRGLDPAGEFRAADEDFEQGLRFNPKDVEAWAGRADLLAGKARFEEKQGRRKQAREDYERAAACYREALRINPSLERRFGEALQDAGRRAEALKEN